MEHAPYEELSSTEEYLMLQNEVSHKPMSLQLISTVVPNIIVPSSSGSSSPKRGTTWEDLVHYTSMGDIVSQ
jgi:hypothetical protein